MKYFTAIGRGDAYGENLTKKIRRMKSLEDRVDDQAFVDQGDRILSSKSTQKRIYISFADW